MLSLYFLVVMPRRPVYLTNGLKVGIMNVNRTSQYGRHYSSRNCCWWIRNLQHQHLLNKGDWSLWRLHVRFLCLTMKNLHSSGGREAFSFSGATERVDFQMATGRDLSRSLSVNSPTRIKTPNVSGHMLERTIDSYGFPTGSSGDHNVYTLSQTRCVWEANCLIVVYIANSMGPGRWLYR